jgi:hypothetical protein
LIQLKIESETSINPFSLLKMLGLVGSEKKSAKDVNQKNLR